MSEILKIELIVPWGGGKRRSGVARWLSAVLQGLLRTGLRLDTSTQPGY